MGKGTKMCKYKSFEQHVMIDRVNQKSTLKCASPDISDAQKKLVNKNRMYCSRRLCPFYESL